MKRFYIPFLLMAAAAVAACESKAVVDEPSNAQESYIFTIKASAPAPATKTDYTATGEFSWTAGDQISVLFNNGSEDRFFTLTAGNIDGAEATFSGAIDGGYSIGSSTDGTKWALYPAGSHKVRFAESDAAKYPFTFNIPPVTDYSESGFSAAIPMYAQGDDYDGFEFHYLCSAYKFTFTDISAASKVKLVVQNQTTYRLSGDVKLRQDDDNLYLDQGWGEGADKVLTYISDVVGGTAVFYVPVRYYAACFQPVITLYDENGGQIFTKTAAVAKAIEEKGHIQPIDISVSGAVVVPWSIPSEYGIDWNSVDCYAAGDTADGIDGLSGIKATADADKLYVLVMVKASALLDNDSYSFGNCSQLYIGNGEPGEKSFWGWEGYSFQVKQEAWLKVNNSPQYYHWKSYLTKPMASENKGIYYYEIAINRADCSLNTSKALVGMYMTNQYVIGDDWLGDSEVSGVVPARWTEPLEVPLP